MNTICTIGFYYGRFNNYFDLFLKSCRFNPKIDFIIVTDIEYTDCKIPGNVKFINMSMNEARHLASRKLDLPVNIQRPYKFCDLKPFYGKILEDYLSQYEYWGWNDFDMIFGDIYSFLMKNNYQKYDKFSPLGHLSFCRNTEKVNSYYKLDGSLCGDYKEVLTNERNYLFDENSGFNAILLKNKISFFTRITFADITPSIKRYTIGSGSSVDGLEYDNYKYQIFYWEKGKVYRAYYDKNKINKEEFMYIHHRSRPNYRVKFDVDEVNSFYITNHGFIEKHEDVTLDIIKKYNKYPGKLTEKCEVYLFLIKLYWQKILRKLKIRSRF